MEDDKLKDFFQDFRPSLSSDEQFIQTLNRNMNAVEAVKKQAAALRRHGRIAVAVAALCGMAAGIILTLLYPLVSGWVSAIDISLPAIGIPAVTLDCRIVAWMVMGLMCVLTGLNAYEITASRLAAKSA